MLGGEEACVGILSPVRALIVQQKEILVFPADDPVAFAGAVAKPGFINNLYPSASIPNNSVCLHLLGNETDTCTLDAQHVSKEFLRQDEMPLAGAFTHYAQPTAQTRLDPVEMIAQAGLRHLF
jgi:hypothetical protein